MGVVFFAGDVFRERVTMQAKLECLFLLARQRQKASVKAVREKSVACENWLVNNPNKSERLLDAAVVLLVKMEDAKERREEKEEERTNPSKIEFGFRSLVKRFAVTEWL